MRLAPGNKNGQILLGILCAALVSSPVQARSQSPPQQLGAPVEGVVRDSAGKSVPGVSVLLQREDGSTPVETTTNADGAFVFLAVPAGAYTIKLKKFGFRDFGEDSMELPPAGKKHLDFVLLATGDAAPASSTTASSANAAIALDDRPTFTVAGVTDSSGSGGHGSATRLRTDDALARETLNLELGKSKEDRAVGSESGAMSEVKPTSETALRAALLQNPEAFESNHRLGEFYFRAQRYREAIPLLEAAYRVNAEDFQNALDLTLAYEGDGEFVPAREQVNQLLTKNTNPGKRDEGELHRVSGDIDEKLEDPLGAVREYERAATLDASEQNYFAWGAELLLHRAATPAVEVFSRGARQHPDSARMLAGLGAALYTSGSAEEGVQRLCEASDLEPTNRAPYLFLGQMQEASATPLPCAEQKLVRFAREQPGDALANYYYGLALWRRDRASENSNASQQAEALFEKSSALDPKLDAPYLQLGNVLFARGAIQEALAAYQKAVAANPTGSEAHYRLGFAYKRLGEPTKAQPEFEQYKQLQQTEAVTIERQARELRQFLFVLVSKEPVRTEVPKD